MNTLYDLRQKIASDLNRANMSAAINDAINEAITHYMPTRFWFNEKIETFQTITDVRGYNGDNGLPTDILEIDVAKVNVSGGEIILKRRTFQYLEDIDRNSFTGNPTIYAWYAGSFYLYPIPNDEYVVTLSYKKFYDELANDEDFNDFTVNAKALIRARAKVILYTDFLKDPEMAQASESSEMKALISLQSRTEQLVMPNETMPVFM